jgi:hypothetical protein
MTRIDDRINRRTALVQLTVATMLGAGAAKAQRPDPSLAQIKTTDLGHKTYMLEGQGGNILVVIGDDGIIMVDAELAPSGRDSDDHQGHGGTANRPPMSARGNSLPCRRVSRKSSLDHPEREITLVCGDAVPTFQNKKGQFRLIRAAKNPRRR